MVARSGPWARRLRAAGQADGLGGLGAAIAIAVAWLSWLLPRGFLRGVSRYWQIDTADVTQYLSGFNVFFSEPWAWPLLKIRGINAPEGTLATLVDVIPAYASVLKLVVPGDRFPFNPYGYWVGLGFVLMAVGGWWLLREARLPRYGVLIPLTGLLVLMPALNGRLLLGHISLTSHWLIVFALALYVRGGRLGRPPLAAWTALLLVGFYVNLYIFVMAGLVFVAGAARFVRAAGWPRTLGRLLLPPALIVASLPVTILPVPHVPGGPEPGFGHYGINLLSPFADGSLFTSWITRHRVWNVQGHYEGYNYLGAGGLLLIATAIVLRARRDTRFFARHAVLVAGLALVTAYALSSRIYLADRLVLAWPVPTPFEWLVGTFRASGRLFWLVGYALVGFAVVTSARWLRPRAATGVLALALLLQGIDLVPLWGIVHAGLRRPPTRIIDSARWDAALGPGVRTIYLHPKYGCTRAEDAHNGILAVQRYAAERRLRLNTGYIARYHPPCDAAPREIAASDPTQSVYVFLPDEPMTASPARQFPPGAHLQCDTLDRFVVCRWTPSLSGGDRRGRGPAGG